MLTPRYFLIILAAGKGERMAASSAEASLKRSLLPKQYLTIKGKTVIEHTLSLFLKQDFIEKIIVVLASDDSYWSRLSIARSEKIITTVGDKTRSLSLWQGLKALKQCHVKSTDWVLSHDAVRPCLSEEDLINLVKTLSDDTVGGTLGTPVCDTLKYVKHGKTIVDIPNGFQVMGRHIQRENMWHILTPQMYRFELLFQAVQKAIEADYEITDASSALELTGYASQIVQGQRTNIKITFPYDLEIADKLLI